MKSRVPYLCFLALGMIFLLVPTENAQIDSWFYAASVKYNRELIHSHHLLYNATGLLWHRLLQYFNPDIEAINSLNYMNAFAATGCLFILFNILALFKLPQKQALWLTLFCGVSFGFMRYATEAETYILPLFFSLSSTYFFIRRTKYDFIWSAAFSVIAILIHQLHLWWALGMFTGLIITRPFNLKYILQFSLPFILVPAVYYLAFLQQEQATSLLAFITGEYHKGNAGLNPSPKSLLLTFINFIRSFIQVHGKVADIFNKNFWLNSGITVLILALFLYLLKTKKMRLSLVKKKEKSPDTTMLLIACILHLVFAFLSSGNAEFMVMLPFLLVLSLASGYSFSSFSMVPAITLSVFMWNMGMAIIPAHFYDLNRVDHQVEFTLNHPNDHLMWKHKPLIENIITYRKGFSYTAHFMPMNSKTQALLDSLVRNHIPVYSDFSNPGTLFSREDFVNDKAYIGGRYRMEEVDTWQNIYGENHIHRIMER